WGMPGNPSSPTSRDSSTIPTSGLTIGISPETTGGRSMLAIVLSLALYVPAADPPKVEVGKPVPEVELQATSIDTVLPDKKDAKTLRLSDLKGKNVVFYFYPKALTGG